VTPHFDEAGYQVVEGLLSAQQVCALRTATGRYREALRHEVPEGVGVTWHADRIQQIMHAERLSETLDAINRSDAVLRHVRAAIGWDVGLYHSKFILKDPGAAEVPWHQDYTYWQHCSSSPCQINCMVYLDDADEENGCLLVLPGSQHGGLVTHEMSADRGAFHDALPDDTTRQAVAVPGRAGDAVFFGPLLHHASGANTSGRSRHSFTTVYTNPLVDVHREVYGCFFPIDDIKAMGGPGPFGFCGEHYQRRNLWWLATDHIADAAWTWVEISDRTLDDGSFAWLSARKPAACRYERFEAHPLVTANRDDVRVRAGALREILDPPAEPLGLVALDCERGAHAAAALQVMAPGLRPGTILICDRFYNYPGWERAGGPYRAVQDFLVRTGWGFDFLGRSFQQVVLRLTHGGPSACPDVSWQPVSGGIIFG
jgi:ectoine hydroxylase-related dioxygenase (phytanoyl-CoA dioxygenase family)